MTIGLLTTLWKRHDLERVVLSYYRDLKVDGVDFVRLAVGSEGATSEAVAVESGWEYIKAPNNPLSDKWNKGAKALRGRVDAICVIGSDDLIASEYFEAALVQIQTGAGAVGHIDCWYYDMDTSECIRIDRAHPGAGMIITAPVLDRMSWEPWPTGVNERLDGAMSNRMHTVGAPNALRKVASSDAVIVDIKSGTNKWSLDDMKQTIGRFTRVSADDLFSKNFPGIREKIHQKPVR